MSGSKNISARATTGDASKDDITMSCTFLNTRPYILAILWSALYFAFFWHLDFPKPTYDDLFFSGAALNLTYGNDFANPLLDGQRFPSHFYFVHPPIYSYALAGWFKLLGVSAASMTGFQATMYLAITAATILILRRFQAPFLLLFLVPLGVSAGFMTLGLRHDSLAVALTMTGFAIACFQCRDGAAGFLPFVFLFAGGATAPRLTLFAGALTVYVIYQSWCNSRTKRSARVYFLFSVSSALLATIMLFIYLIDFRILEFLETFHLHMQRLNGSKLHSLATFLYSGFSQCPILLLLVFLGVMFIHHRPAQFLIMCAALSLAFPTMGLIGGLGPGSFWYAVLLVFVLLVALIPRISRLGQLGLMSGLVFTLVFANGKLFANAIGIVSGKIITQPSPESRRSVLATALSAKGSILLDGSAARYSFDYNLPPNCLNLEYAAPFPGGFPERAQLREGDVIVVGPQTLGYLAGVGYPVKPHSLKWKAPGIGRWDFFAYPFEVFVISSESCMPAP
jgi:hypothetical protein